MKICFSMAGVGLANNGGSRTLIRCVETLRKLGYDAFFHSGPHHYTWHKPKIKLVGGKEHPKCDVTIATGINSFDTVTRYKQAKRTAYIRGLETWKVSEAKLIEKFKRLPHVFVNSEWLLRYMQSHDIPATLQYSGLDTEWFCDLGGERAGVGALMHNKHLTKRSKDAVKLEERLGMSFQYLNKHIKHPNSPTLNKWYNKLKVWFAPTELEGLHNPPMEAALAGCALVCTDHPRSGMSDYAIHGETALVYPARDLKKAGEYIQELLVDEYLRSRLQRRMVELLRDKIRTRPEQMGIFAERMKSYEL